MADLDDFFAKKDKKKGKTKKFLSSEELVKQLEQQTTIKEKIIETKIVEESNSDKVVLDNDDEDEWATFEEAKKVDLSNLKLGQLTLDEEEQNQISNNDGNSESGVQQQSDDNEKNPWKKIANESSAPSTTSATTVAAPAKPASNVYVPPSVTRGEAMMKIRSKKKNMPDLQNELSFPELGTEKPVEVKTKKDGFEEVKHGAAHKNIQAQQAPVSTANTYTSLSLNEADAS